MGSTCTMMDRQWVFLISHDTYFRYRDIKAWHSQEMVCSSLESVIVAVFDSRQVNHTFAGRVRFSHEADGCAPANSIPASSSVYQFIGTSVLAGWHPWKTRNATLHDVLIKRCHEGPDEKNRSDPERQKIRNIFAMYLYKWESGIRQLRRIFLPLQRISLRLLSQSFHRSKRQWI